MDRRALLGGAVAGALAGSARTARAQTYPARPIRLIVPYPPGGGTDTLTRPFSERIRTRLGQPMIIENRGGAATNIGMEAAARAAPDGQTVIVNADNVAYFEFLYPRRGYDLFRDFVPITYMAVTPMVLGLHPGVPARDLSEFVALVRAQPDRFAFANPSVGSPHHLAYELFAREAGLRMLQVEYRGGGPATNDVIAGHVHLGVFSLGSVSQHFQAGTLRPLALLSERRSTANPDIPTIAEAGFPAAVTALRFLMLAPAGTPPEIVRTLHAATVDTMGDPGLRDILTRAGFEIMTTTPEEAAALLRAERDRWAPILPSLNLRLE